MKMGFRWFGASDSVSLQNIRQIPILRSIVGTMEGKAEDSVWTVEEFQNLKNLVGAHSLSLDVIESIPIAEAIKQGKPERDALIDIFCQSLRNMGNVGIPVLCYNFMPAFDWMRTNLKLELPDGSFVTEYHHEEMLAYDLSKGLETRVAWARGFSAEDLQSVFQDYAAIDENALFENLAYFLNRVIPVAEEVGVHLALHPDDPPWSIFGLPRIVRDAPTIQRILDCVDSPHNGLTFCTGSLGTLPENDLCAMIHQFEGRIHFAHLRNVEIFGEKSFREVAHSAEEGHVKMRDVMQALVDIQYQGVIRPDHGRAIWGEIVPRIGYGLYDRALAAMYLYGLWEALSAKG
jgi:mannonate dehydratase